MRFDKGEGAEGFVWLVVGFKGTPAYMDSRCGVSGVDEREASSLLDGRLSSEALDRGEETGLAASDRERDFGDGRSGCPNEVFLSPAVSVSAPESLCSCRWESCSLSLLAKGTAGRLCDRVEGVVEEVIMLLAETSVPSTRVNLCSRDKIKA